MTGLVPSDPRRDDDIDALRARLADRERLLDERTREIARAQQDLARFRLRYRRDVGLLHEELEALEQAIAELELGEIGKRLDEAAQAPGPVEAAPRSDSVRTLTSDAVRRLFRDVAKAIHPDLARDADARDRRHTLMIEANRAYALGDGERLRSILAAWEASPEAVTGSDADASRQRLVRRLGQVDDQLAACAGELAELQDSPLWALKAMVDEAASLGKDLVADQVRRLERDIIAAQNRLEAMRL
jgi:hypothetical protein